MTVEPEEFGDRGLVTYGPVKTSYGHLVEVRSSSSAEGPHCWLDLKGGGQFVGEDSTAHLNVEQARAIRDRLNAWLGDEPGQKSQREYELEALIEHAVGVLQEDPEWK